MTHCTSELGIVRGNVCVGVQEMPSDHLLQWEAGGLLLHRLLFDCLLLLQVIKSKDSFMCM